MHDPKPNLGITKIEEPGSFIYVDKTKNKYIVVFQPDNERNKLYAASLFIDFTIDYIVEMTIPDKYLHYASLKITKIVMDNFQDEVFVGSMNFKDEPQTFHNFNISERDFKLLEKVGDYRIKNTVPTIKNTAYKTNANITHFIGVRVATNEEVYVRYNNTTDTIESEIAYFSEAGDITLLSLCLTKENTVIVCGYITLHSEGDQPPIRKPYINIVLV